MRLLVSDQDAAQQPPPESIIAAVAAAMVRVAELQGVATVAPEGLDAADAARFVGVSRSSFYQLDERGLVPAAVLVGDTKRVWPRSELRAWLLAGAPSRLHWRAMRDQALRKAG
jgi:predicted DNA-binding transcriptional regulator AlpA